MLPIRVIIAHWTSVASHQAEKLCLQFEKSVTLANTQQFVSPWICEENWDIELNYLK